MEDLLQCAVNGANVLPCRLLLFNAAFNRCSMFGRIRTLRLTHVPQPLPVLVPEKACPPNDACRPDEIGRRLDVPQRAKFLFGKGFIV
jgi:hypothetical protein